MREVLPSPKCAIEAPDRSLFVWLMVELLRSAKRPSLMEAVTLTLLDWLTSAALLLPCCVTVAPVRAAGPPRLLDWVTLAVFMRPDWLTSASVQRLLLWARVAVFERPD